MLTLFYASILQPRQVDEDSTAEAAAARAAGMDIHLLDWSALVDVGDVERAVRRVPEQTQPALAVLRGAMLRVETYTLLYAALLRRDVRLITDPTAYEHTHHLPASLNLIADMTPQTVVYPLSGGESLPLDRLAELLQPFGDTPIMVKDYVKSRKHEWLEACYIPNAADTEAVARVVQTFCGRQDPDLVGGLVFRAFEPFEAVGTHPKSSTPLTKEYRIWWLDGTPIAVVPHWNEVEYHGDGPPVADFNGIARRVRSRFFTMDVAQRIDGAWRIVELGDGQVAWADDQVNLSVFYGSLARMTL
jgi:hypothetical protein